MGKVRIKWEKIGTQLRIKWEKIGTQQNSILLLIGAVLSAVF